MHAIKPSRDLRDPSWPRRAQLLICLCLPLLSARSSAATLSVRDSQVIARSIGFLDPAPTGGVIPVAYDAANPASKADADAIAGLFAGGLIEGDSNVTAKPVDQASLGDAHGYIAIIAAPFSSGAAIMQAVKAHRIPCITAEASQVRAGQCVMSVQSDPKVEIIVNQSAAQASGVSFQTAFRMLIHEI